MIAHILIAVLVGLCFAGVALVIYPESIPGAFMLGFGLTMWHASQNNH
jgi:hypothetical protein